MLHDCIFEADLLPDVTVEMYGVRCRCHSNRFDTVTEQDSPYYCPNGRTSLNWRQIRDLAVR